ncbi:hypothetical protein ABPG72_006817 [Tetrahymena utriculariae]
MMNKTFILKGICQETFIQKQIFFQNNVKILLNQALLYVSLKKILIKRQKIFIHFYNYMADKIVDPTNLENPFGYQRIYLETQTSFLQSQQLTAYFENYCIKSDTGLFLKSVDQVQDFFCRVAIKLSFC